MAAGYYPAIESIIVMPSLIQCHDNPCSHFPPFLSSLQEEDPDTKQVYFFLFKLLRRCILKMSKPQIEGPLGMPPFEKPSIAKAVTNFVLYKFGHLANKGGAINRECARKSKGRSALGLLPIEGV